MLLESENNSGKLQIISGKFQNSGKCQNNAINDAKQISLSRVIESIIYRLLKKKCRRKNKKAGFFIRNSANIVSSWYTC